MTGSLDGWVHDDGCVWCPRCNKAITCEPDIASILAAPGGHRCEEDSGTGLYLKEPAPGWYWVEPDGSLTPIAGQFGQPYVA